MHQVGHSLGMVESLLTTPMAEEVWNEHWSLVRRQRRRYFGHLLLLGASVCLWVFLLVPSVAERWAEAWWWTILWLPFPLLASRLWKGRVKATVAPFAFLPRHQWPRWAFVLLYLGSVVAGFAAAGAAWLPWLGPVCALPFVVGGLQELSRPVPAFPEPWRRYTSG